MQYRVSGPDVERVREIALKVGQIVAANPDAKQVNFDWMEPDRQVRIRVDQNEARLLGLSSQAIATVLNTVISGTPVTQVRDDIYLVNVVARATDEQRVSLDGLRNLQVPLPGGQTVPLSQFASFEYDQEFPLVWRRDRVPTLTVQAAIVGDKLPESVVTSLSPAIENFRKSLPSSYSVVVGGTVEESQKSQASVLAVVPVMLFVMFTVLMVQLQSFPRLFMVLSVAPLGLIGVVAALMLSGRPLGFVAILGVLALARHDQQERGHSDRSDRRRTRFGQDALGRCGGCQQLPFSADHVDGRIDCPRDDSNRANSILGTDGIRDHGRTRWLPRF